MKRQEKQNETMELNNITTLFVLVLMTLPNLGQLVYGLPAGNKQLVRRFERCSFKITRTKCSQTFNSLCIREGLLPKYSNIYTFKLSPTAKIWETDRKEVKNDDETPGNTRPPADFWMKSSNLIVV